MSLTEPFSPVELLTAVEQALALDEPDARSVTGAV